MQSSEEFDPVEAMREKWKDRCLLELGPLVPEAEDPSVLFANNWLAKGQAYGLVASAGVGKSSMTLQMALHWAIGMEFIAGPTRPLKIAIIQAEDSDRDLKEQRDGMIQGLMAEGIPDRKILEAFARIQFPESFVGVQGDEFVTMLGEYQREHDFDVLIINPLQRFFGSDVSDQAAVSRFCAGLDKIMKDPDHGCAMGIVMHTPKFHSGVKDNRQSVDDYAEYAMAGSQEWTAWLRAVINFQKHGSSEEYFDVKASKRGKRLGWKDHEGNTTTKRIFKHSNGFIYWQEVTDQEEVNAIPELEAEKKPAMEPFSAAACASQIAGELADRFGASSAAPHCRNALVKDAYRIIKPLHRTKADAEAAVDAIFQEPDAYGVRIVKHPQFTGQTIARED